MDMASLQLYKNPYNYPDYGNIAKVGNAVPCTPNGIGFKNGTIAVASRISNFNDCNYLSITRRGKTIYGWIDDVRFLTEDSYEIDYSVDAWRTYRGNVTLGVQFVARQPQSTYKRDDLLGSDQAYPDVSYHPINHINSNKRVLVVQVRGDDSDYTSFSATPVQPNPYQFFVKEYLIDGWFDDPYITDLMESLVSIGETTNIVTMYSIPYLDTSGMQDYVLRVSDGQTSKGVVGFKIIDDSIEVASRLRFDIPLYFNPGFNKNALLRVDHSVQLVIPDAGIINIPDEVLLKDNLVLRQEVDIYSGASNYMVVSGSDGDNMEHYNLSVRGNSVGSIPVLSDPMQTYISQNQNALTTSLIGDVASIAGGGLVASFGGPGGAGMGLGMASSGINGIFSKFSSALDSSTNMSNPPAFLGTAMANNYNNRAWIVVKSQNVDNASIVNSNYGYPINKVKQLNFPSSGYIKTEGCSVTTDGTVPRWAVDDINTMFNNGVLVN